MFKRFWRRLDNFFSAVYWAIAARIDALTHKFRGHDLIWAFAADEVCKGDIVCENCPDTAKDELGRHVGLVFWCRAHDPWWVVDWDGTEEGECRGRYVWQFWKRLK